ncbi:antiviral reverse transcriptase Drt3a [Pseudovibrio denitrificans]|uniref:antiviral reverse transcriptase Drt3a n=1 Tax=Pseudovibrio denitrificans TaxID=258256 RepID=UPI0039BFD167
MPLDQSFSAENFQLIYDAKNRRGFNFEEVFFPELKPLTNEIRRKREAIRALRKNPTLSSGEKLAEGNRLKVEIKDQQTNKQRILDSHLSNIETVIAGSSFSLNLERKIGPQNKNVMTTGECAASFFAVNLIQRNLRKIYKIKQADRHHIVRCIKQMLSNGFPLTIVRTDISSFYESINCAVLLKRLDEDQLLSLKSRQLIRKLLNACVRHDPSATGLPRGVGVSAYLAELYMRPIDEEIKSLPGIVFYGRFVDDICIIASDPIYGSTINYEDKLQSIVSNYSLTLNPNKTDTYKNTNNCNMDYLGYEFQISAQDCKLELSQRKIAKYQKRIDRAFDEYNFSNSKSKKEARLLIQRINFLTSNTRLANNKSVAKTGVFFNNSEATETGKLRGLDGFLTHKINSLQSPWLKNKLGQNSFERGFKEKAFTNFTTHQLGKIVKAWEYE